MKYRNIVLTGLLVAIALVFNIIEGFLPFPLPGVKLGAANVFALVALVIMGAKEAFAVTLLRVVLAWLITGNWFAFLCSMSGGLLGTLVMVILYTRMRSDFTLPWISVAGAWAFNAGQVAVAAYLVSDARVLYYMMPLFIAGTFAGWGVGLLAQMLCVRIGKITGPGRDG